MFPIFSSHLQEFQLKYSQCLVLQVFCFITFMQPKLFQFKRWLAFGALFGFSKCSCSCFFLMICAVRSYAWNLTKIFLLSVKIPFHVSKVCILFIILPPMWISSDLGCSFVLLFLNVIDFQSHKVKGRGNLVFNVCFLFFLLFYFF